MNKKRVVWIVLNVIVVLALLMAGCATQATDETPPEQPTTEQPTELPETEPPTIESPKEQSLCSFYDGYEEILEVNQFYVEGQVILSGDSENLNDFATGINLKLLASCQDPFVNGSVMNLYMNADTNQVLIELDKYNSLKSTEITRDLNYLVGHQVEACSNPFGVEGSPFGVEGSPFGVEGSPFGVEGSPYGQPTPNPPGGGPQGEADFDTFNKQWALKNIGLVEADGKRKVDIGEKGVIVAIMDTSPFTLSNTVLYTKPVEGFNLTVHHPFQLQNINRTTYEFKYPDKSYDPQDRAELKDHGLFVAGLVHVVAPSSEIHLYRVLDHNGCGTLYNLITGINELKKILQNNPKTVLNLSLGILTSGKQINTIQPLLDDLYSKKNVLIVAAAGNGSVNEPGVTDTAMEADLPAAFDNVIGVAASNMAGNLACYSNQGDVMAPGGEAELVSTPYAVEQPYCEPRTGKCVDSPDVDSDNGPNCGWGLISLITNPNPSGTGYVYSYAYWVGTSFATPLVSGMAALYYQDKSRDDVIALIPSSPTTPIPVITIIP